MSDSHLSFWPDQLDQRAGRRMLRDGPASEEALRSTDPDARPGRPQRDGDLGFAPALRRQGADLPTDEPAPLGDSFAIELRDERGETLHRLTTPVPPPQWIEHFRPDGTMGWSLEPQPFSIELPAEHADAVMALVSREGWAESLQVAVTRKPQEPCEVWKGDLKPHLRYPIVLVAEQFDDKERFWQACAQFETALLNAAPFDRAELLDLIGVVGLWWPQTREGLFQTKYYADKDLIYGIRDMPLKWARTKRDCRVAVAVVDSDHWAGAGGLIDQLAAFSSIENFNPRWVNVALHELGHSFTLQDEYYVELAPGETEDARSKAYEYSNEFPNVSDSPNVLDSNWAHDATEGLNHNPTKKWDSNQQLDADVIGTFQGAFYSKTKYYRPHATCRMRKPTEEFCPVCQNVIVNQLKNM